MPQGGILFAALILIFAGLLTWGIVELAQHEANNNDSDDSSADTTLPDADSDLQAALNEASPGDYINIPSGTHYISLTTAVDGTADNPITIRGAPGTDREDVILKGDDDEVRVLEIFHSHYVIEDFTIDGEIDEDDDEYMEQLIYVEGTDDPEQEGEYDSSINNVVIRDMVLRNAGKECVRLQHFVTDSVIMDNEIRNCGITDFQVEDDGENGEGVYIGTAPDQWDDKTDGEPDVCAGNFVLNNVIETRGGEGVDVKEGSRNNVVEGNEIFGQIDPDSGGIGISGSNNVVRNNVVVESIGACIRLGGAEVDGVQYGINNEVYENDLIGCENSGLKIINGPQSAVCENEITVPSDADDGSYLEVRGEASEPYLDQDEDCPSDLSFYPIPPTPTPDSEDTNDSDDEDDSDEDEDSSDDEDEASETPSPETSPTPQPTPGDSTETGSGYSYVGCYKDDRDDRVLTYNYEDESDMTIEACVDACFAASRTHAGLQFGRECWCGSPASAAEYNVYGTGVCDNDCSGDGDQDCGGYDTFSLFLVISGDNMEDRAVAIASDATSAPTATPVVATPVSTPEPATPEPATPEPATPEPATPEPATPEPTTPKPVAAPTPEPTPEPTAEPTVEEEDDDAVAVAASGTYLGCYRTSESDPVLTLAYDDNDMTPTDCVSHCTAAGEEYSGLGSGSECYCGTDVEYSRMGAGTCNLSCSGATLSTCGGTAALSVYEN